MVAVFRLQGPQDLFQKLKHEYVTLNSNPTDSYGAYNFFVTAWHLLDWLYPGDANKSVRSKLRGSEPLLQVLDHLASGAKHFEIDPKRHTSVRKTGGPPSWAEIPFSQSPGRRPVNSNVLYVFLDGPAATRYGPYVSVTDLASKVVDFWEQRLNSSQSSVGSQGSP